MTILVTDDQTIPSLTESSSLCMVHSDHSKYLSGTLGHMDEAACVWRQLALANPRAEEINSSVGLPHITAYLQGGSVLNWMSWKPEDGEAGIGGWGWGSEQLS